MKRKWSTALLALAIAACGDGGITGPGERDALLQSPTALALGVDSTTGASIETNKDDYAPGEVVHLVGRGWAPNETVNLHMTEEPNTHADVDTNVVADASGEFSIHFYDVQVHDIGVTFTLTATGQTSGSKAVAGFTDGVPVVHFFKVNSTTFSIPASPPNAPATNPITVAPGAVVSVDVNASTVSGSPGQANWKSTEIAVRSGVSVAFGDTDSCDETDVHTSNTVVTTTHSISYTMPMTPGTYDMRVSASRDDGCAGGGFVTYNGAIIVSAPANSEPTVTAGDDKSVAEGTPISLGGVGGASASDTDSDPLTYAWTIDKSAMDAGGDCVFGPGAATDVAPTITCDDDSNSGTIKLTLTVDDGQGHVVSDFLLLTVTNANPIATISNGPYSGAEGSAIQLTGAGNDPGDNDDALTYLWSVNSAGITNGGTCSVSNETSPTLATVSCTDNGSATVSLQVSDDDGGSHTVNVGVTVTNANPVANADGDYTGTEGGSVSLTGTFTDAGSNDTHTYKWTYAAGAGVDGGTLCTFSDDTVLSPEVSCDDDGSFTLTLKVTDDDGGVDTDDATLTLGNALPSVSITSPADYSIISLLSGAIAVVAPYSDAGGHDTHYCEVFLDGAIPVLNAYSPVLASPCSRTILPVEAGLYDLTVRIRDDDGGVGSATINIVVYDPSAGFVTGGGWINSPAEAYTLDLTAAGKANFGFVSKYKKGANTPDGNTEFQFHAGALNFHSSTYQWLVVNQAGTNAQFKGTGTINGQGSYTFMLWATDGGNTYDKFRIQITDNNDNDKVIYDNGTDQLIAGGSIVIHTGGKK